MLKRNNNEAPVSINMFYEIVVVSLIIDAYTFTCLGNKQF